MKGQSRIRFAMPASEAVATICRRITARMEQAGSRLHQHSDEEALHDLRVAMRQMRSTFRAYPGELPRDKTIIKRLKQLAGLTNPARDAEVRVMWLQQAVEELPAYAQRVMPDVIAYAERQVREAYQTVDEQVAGEINAWTRMMKKALKAMPTSKDAKCFGELFAERLGAVTERLDRQLHALEGEADFHAVHETRITGKQVRYLLDPLQGEIPGIKPLIKELKKLQDLLGEFHDAQVRLDWLAETVDTLGGRYAQARFGHLIETGGRSARIDACDPVPALLALTRITLSQQKHLFQQVLHEQRQGRYRDLIARLRVQCVRSRGRTVT